MSPNDFCPVCGASVLVVQSDEGTAHYQPLDEHLAREWEQRWEGERQRAERAEAKLKAIESFATELVTSYNPLVVRQAGQWTLDRLKENKE